MSHSVTDAIMKSGFRNPVEHNNSVYGMYHAYIVKSFKGKTFMIVNSTINFHSMALLISNVSIQAR